MPLPIPKLFNKSYQQLVEESIASIPKYSDVWTNYNPSDPGITILELLCWVAENTLYRIDRIPENAYLNFLRLIAGASGTEVDALLNEKDLDKDYKEILYFLKRLEEKKLFTVDLKYSKSLEQREISRELREKFILEGFLITDYASVLVKQPGKKWLIEDGDRKYFLVKENDELFIIQKGEEFSIEEIKSFALRFMKSRYRAITEEDFRVLAIQSTEETTSIQVKRAIVQSYPEEGKIEVIIVAQDNDHYQDLIPIVRQYLEDRKLIGTWLEVKPPVYTPVNITMEITCPFHIDRVELGEQIKKRIQEYLDPLAGGPDKTGWPYRRSLTIYELSQIIEENKDVKNVHRILLENGQIEMPVQGLVALENLVVHIREEFR